MEQGAMLVTSDGKRVLPESDAFFVTLSALAPGYETIGFAVSNLGFIKFEVLERRVTIIELNPHCVQRLALLAAERRIRQSGAQLFLIKYFGADPRSQTALSAEEAIAQLRALHAPPAKPASGERFRCEPQDYAKLLRSRSDPLALFGRKWCASFGAFDQGVLAFAAEISVLPQLKIMGVRSGGHDPVFRFVGDGYVWLNRQYGASPIGEPLETMLDKEYGAWAAPFYRSVASIGEPRFDLVSATLHDAAGQPHGVRYKRLMLPWKAASDEILVTTVSKFV